MHPCTAHAHFSPGGEGATALVLQLPTLIPPGLLLQEQKKKKKSLDGELGRL